MGLSGKLLEETNTVNGVVVKYSEPTEARKPKTRWRLYVFKGSEELPILYIHRQSAYLLGRDRKVSYKKQKFKSEFEHLGPCTTLNVSL